MVPQRIAPWRLLRFYFLEVGMKDLRSQAIVLIYPDGTIEKIIVKKGVSSHLDYFHDWIKYSKKFAKIIYDSPYKIDFKNWVVLDRVLAESGVVVFRNMQIIYLASNISLVNSEEPFGYLVQLPGDIRESKAYIPMKEILRENQSEEYTFGIYSLEAKEFEEIKYNFIEEKLENKEEEIKR